MDTLLSKSYRNCYRFSLGTTSFIYPATYGDNVAKLAPYLDEIELLLFESRGRESLPSEEEIGTLARIREKEGVDYNIHLPVDVSLSSGDRADRVFAAEKLKEVVRLTSILEPTTYTLHLPFEGDPDSKSDVSRWVEHTCDGMEVFLDAGLDPRLISVETLDYPPELFGKVIERFNLSVCLDLGHLIRYGFDLMNTFDLYKERATIIHLHGVNGGRDHLALDRMEKQYLAPVESILKTFRGTVSLEVFSFKNLASSLPFLNTLVL